MLSISDDVQKDKQYKNKIINELIKNTIYIIYFDSEGNTHEITEDNIVSESMTLKQSICDEDKLKFGGCIASEFDIQLINTEDKTFEADLAGKKIWVLLSQYYPSGEYLYPSSGIYPSDTLFPGEITNEQNWMIFVGTIDSAKRDQSDKNIFNIVAYDPIAQLYQSNKNVSNKLYKAMINGEATTQDLLSLCLDSLEYKSEDFEMYSARQLRNYWWESEKKKNSNSTKITKGELLAYICEASCGFGYYRPGEFAINTVPAKIQCGKLRLLNANDSIHGTEEYEFYESLTTDEKFVSNFEGIIFPYAGDIEDRDKSDWGNKTGIFNGKLIAVDDDPDEYNNFYDLSENILAWDYSSRDNPPSNLQKIKVFYNKLSETLSEELDYMPITAVLDGRLWVEVGDTIKIQIPETNVYGEYVDKNGNVVDDIANAKINTITSRVLSRTITGIQALTDTIEAKGEIS